MCRGYREAWGEAWNIHALAWGSLECVCGALGREGVVRFEGVVLLVVIISFTLSYRKENDNDYEKHGCSGHCQHVSNHFILVNIQIYGNIDKGPQLVIFIDE